MDIRPSTVEELKIENRKLKIAPSRHGENPLILALETSGRLGSVTLAQGEKILGLHNFTGPMRHSAEVFPAIVDLLKKFDKKACDIEQIFISVGPGSFTGLRISVTIAKSFALANQSKIVAVDTLDVIADNVISFAATSSVVCPPPSNILAVILDAKRGQFFIAVYAPCRYGEKTGNGWQKLIPDSLLTSEEFMERAVSFGGFTDKPIAIIGEGLVFYKDKFTGTNVQFLDEKFWYPSATSVYKLGLKLAQQGLFADPLTLTPNYLRAALDL